MQQYTCKHLCVKSHPIKYSCYLGRNLNEPFFSCINYRTMRGDLASKLYTTLLYGLTLGYCDDEHVAAGKTELAP